MSDDFALAPPQDFSFPFRPYAIQKDFMRRLFEAVEQRKVGIFESPTGTGKSLSVICSSLTWLRLDRKRLTEEAVAALSLKLKAECPDEPNWVLEHNIERKKRELLADEEALENRLQAIRRQEADAKRNQKAERPGEKASKKRKVVGIADHSDEEFAPDDEESRKDEIGPNGLPRSVQDLLDKYGGANGRHQQVELEPDAKKIYFTSRTHSQLSQFVDELRKTTFGDSTRLIALGSRANLCINEEVKKNARSLETLNEACTDLQKGETTARCPYLPPVEDVVLMNDFRDHALSEARDIEELASLGRERNVCPYYGGRKALKQAQVVTLPYNLLLQKSSRNALGISLEENIVIVDEAHNLIDNVLSIHSASLTSTFLNLVKNAFMIYIQRFAKKLKGTNLVYLKQLLRVLECLGTYCQDWAKTIPANSNRHEEIMTVNLLLQKTGILDQLNMRDLEQYLTESKIVYKISGYATKIEANEKKEKSEDRAFQTRSAFVTGFYKIQDFILALSNANQDGRVLLSGERASKDEKMVVTLKYQLLNPSECFRDVVSETRAVILAGGTMAPISDFCTQLFPYLGADQFIEFSCPHIVPQDNLLVRVVCQGPGKTPLELKFASKTDSKLQDELGQSIANICNVVKDGVVVFFPSYAILELLRARWKTTGLMGRLETRKEIVEEPKSSAEVETTLDRYASGIHLPVSPRNGALLFAVVGGKLSEGINFSNELCRAVLVIGIPYPNANSIELKERIKYAECSSGGKREAGLALYANMAFKAVNQSIGRAIRHANDWSAIILLDARYGTESSQKKLPGWIRSSLKTSESFGSLVKDLAQFNQRMANQKTN
ncbi:hypothetical protein CROQUDRAFT_61025 [Cronartium quercuum f. sp. fusiforme G11]|uniref:ATP-dependent DNA helicase CHL1 n=1 Tax=Cronartium quercuum f. sp. fusiforme G11 TaxID=708437 RepID=A0A9P6NR23_9BASI|nr:hypothetical protein CROQUDRAFT_61025 [Cronartium quercuum f. sp. fusiforme G11]